MPDYPLRCDVRRTESTTDLLTHLHRSETGFQPYLLTAWSPELTAQDAVALPLLAVLLDEPLALRKPRTGHDPARRLTWHCAIRNTTTAELDDDDWFELTREVLDSTGIEPDDDQAACRWVALRNQAGGLDIVATVIRQDGRWARLHDDTYFARSRARTSPTTTDSTRRHDDNTAFYHRFPDGPNRGTCGSSSPGSPTRAPLLRSPSRSTP